MAVATPSPIFLVHATRAGRALRPWLLAAALSAALAGVTGGSASGALGLAMVFILLTYGGWNEAAYLSAEIEDARRNMVRVLMIGTAAIVGAYVLINLAYLYALRFDALHRSEAVAAAMKGRAFGDGRALLLNLLICCSAVSTVNATSPPAPACTTPFAKI